MRGRSILSSGWVLLVMRGLFFLVLAGVSILALVPTASTIAGNDKFEHFAAFFVLAVLGVLSWSRHNIMIGLSLMAFGALLEILQGTPLIHRDMSGFDWLADSIGVVVGLGIGVAFLSGVADAT